MLRQHERLAQALGHVRIELEFLPGADISTDRPGSNQFGQAQGGILLLEAGVHDHAAAVATFGWTNRKRPPAPSTSSVAAMDRMKKPGNRRRASTT